MARRLGDELNELRIRDNISGSTIVLYYRMPTTEEVVRYTNDLIKRRRNKVISQLGETRQKYGSMILEGFRKGDFEKRVGKKYVPLISDPDSKNYDSEWKEHVKKYAADLIELLAVHVFEAPAETEDEESDIKEIQREDETLPEEADLEKN